MIDNKILKPSYEVHRYDFAKLFQLGTIEDEQLVCNTAVVKNAEILKSGHCDLKGNCQLFDQFEKQYPELLSNNIPQAKRFEDIFINIDFTNYLKSNNADVKRDLLKIRNGIVFTRLDNEKVTYIDFLKSNSMSKNACIFYMNKNYEEMAKERILFHLNEGQKVTMPKWYAYSGLVLSDTNILDDIHFKPGEIVVVDDLKNNKLHGDIYTAISVKYLLDLYNDLLVKLNKFDDDDPFYLLVEKNVAKVDVINIDRELLSYANSKEVNSYRHNDAKDNNQSSDDEISEFNQNTNNKNKKSKTNLSFKQVNRMYIYNLLKDYKYDRRLDVKALKEKIASLVEKQKIDFEIDLEKNNHKTKETYWQMITAENCPIEVNKFDGEGLISLQFLDEITDCLNNKQGTSGIYFGSSFQIRLPFIKGVVHSCDLKKFYSDKGITSIKGLTFNEEQPTRDYPVDRIKMILTKSQFKAYKLIRNCPSFKDVPSKFDAFIDTLNRYRYSLGVAFEHGLEDDENKHVVRLNYQFLSTLPFNEGKLEKIIDMNKDIFRTATSEKNILNNIKLDNSEYYEADKRLINDHKQFYLSTERYKKNREKIINSYRNNFYQMKLYTDGYRKYLCGDLLELLYHTIYSDPSQLRSSFRKHKLPKGEFYAPNVQLHNARNAKPAPYVLLRNPHYSSREICLLNAYTQGGEREEYFGHLTGVLMVNPESFAAERLGGADYDGDEVVLLTDENRESYTSALGKVAKLGKPFIKIPSFTSEPVEYNFEEKANCLKNTFSSRVGKISNNALTKLFKLNGNGDMGDENNKIALYTILCGLEIDSVKNGLKPYLPPASVDKCADFYIKLKDRLDGSNKVTNKDKRAMSCEQFRNRNNIMRVCNMLDTLVEGSQTSHKFKLKPLNDVNINDEGLLKIIIAHLIYKSLRRYNFTRNSSGESNVYGNILQICNNEDYIDDLIDSFASDNAYDTLQRYCGKYSPTKFHYLNSKEDKLDYIKNELGFDIDSIKKEHLDRVCDFSNNGMYLLYYILVYNKFKEYINSNNKDYLLDASDMYDEFTALLDVCDKQHYLIDEDYYDLEDKLFNEVSVINDIITNAVDYKDEISQVMDELRSYVSKVKFDNYLFFAKFNTPASTLKGVSGNNFVFDVLIDNLIKYLD